MERGGAIVMGGEMGGDGIVAVEVLLLLWFRVGWVLDGGGGDSCC